MGDVGRLGQAAASIGVAGMETAANMAMNAANNSNQRSIAREYNQAQADLAQYQNDYNMQMWNMQNEYNSPQAQMERLEAAGLNPNLIYGSGSAVGNSTSAPAEAAKPDIAMPEYQRYELQGELSKAMAMYNQMRATDSQVELAKSQADVAQSQAEHNRIRNILEGAKTPYAQQIADYEIDSMHAAYNKLRSEEVGAKYDAMTKEYRYHHTLPLEAQIARVDLQLKNRYSERVRVQTARTLYELENIVPKITELKQKQIDELVERIALIGHRARLVKGDADFFENFGLSNSQTSVILRSLGHMIRLLK